MDQNPGPALRVEPFLLKDHVVVVLLAVGLGQSHDLEEAGPLQRAEDVLMEKRDSLAGIQNFKTRTVGGVLADGTTC